MDEEALIETLGATPTWLADGFQGLGAKEAWRRPVSSEWSAGEILGHLRAADAIIRPRVFHLLVRPGGPLVTFDERVWATVAARASLPIDMQLQSFSAARAEVVAVLRSLRTSEWDIEGNHEERGPVSLRAIVTHLASHEAGHRRQFEAAVASARREAT